MAKGSNCPETHPFVILLSHKRAKWHRLVGIRIRVGGGKQASRCAGDSDTPVTPARGVRHTPSPSPSPGKAFRHCEGSSRKFPSSSFWLLMGTDLTVGTPACHGPSSVCMGSTVGAHCGDLDPGIPCSNPWSAPHLAPEVTGPFTTSAPWC